MGVIARCIDDVLSLELVGNAVVYTRGHVGVANGAGKLHGRVLIVAQLLIIGEDEKLTVIALGKSAIIVFIGKVVPEALTALGILLANANRELAAILVCLAITVPVPLLKNLAGQNNLDSPCRDGFA